MKEYLLAFLAIIIAACSIFLLKNMTNTNQEDKNTIRYVAIGDSYTVGEDVSSDESWPEQLVGELKENSVSVSLIANPSVTGWTTQDVIDKELKIFENSNPEFATLLIGVNDWVQGVSKETFKNNLIIILGQMQNKLPDKQKLILVTIPDFSKTPTGKNYDRNGDAEEGILEFNNIIKEEGQKRNLPVVDIYPISQQTTNDPTLIASDGLHPSGKQYKLWTNEIYPVALKMLKK